MASPRSPGRGHGLVDDGLRAARLVGSRLQAPGSELQAPASASRLRASSPVVPAFSRPVIPSPSTPLLHSPRATAAPETVVRPAPGRRRGAVDGRGGRASRPLRAPRRDRDAAGHARHAGAARHTRAGSDPGGLDRLGEGARRRRARARRPRGGRRAAYLLVYGTSFTKAPRISKAFIDEASTRAAADGTGSAGIEQAVGRAIDARVADLVAAARAPGNDERLAWVRETLTRVGARPDTPAGASRAAAYLLENFARVTRESRKLGAALSESRSGGDRADLARRAHLFATRPLASDTSWPIAFAVHDALADLRGRAVLGAGAVRRIAVVGPGLDFVDKAEGHDYYAPQALQPFALVDSVLALGLASLDDLRVTTFDVSPRVNGHLRRVASRARGVSYDVQMTMDSMVPWTEDARAWWHTAGSRAGAGIEPLEPPANAGTLECRAVRVAPDVLRLLVPVDLDIVYQRAELPVGERFDVAIATNVLIYYDAFEQAFAAANIASMLRPGGILLTNDWLGDGPRLPLQYAGERLVRFSARPGDGERMHTYRRAE